MNINSAQPYLAAHLPNAPRVLNVPGLGGGMIQDNPVHQQFRDQAPVPPRQNVRDALSVVEKELAHQCELITTVYDKAGAVLSPDCQPPPPPQTCGKEVKCSIDAPLVDYIRTLSDKLHESNLRLILLAERIQL